MVSGSTGASLEAGEELASLGTTYTTAIFSKASSVSVNDIINTESAGVSRNCSPAAWVCSRDRVHSHDLRYPRCCAALAARLMPWASATSSSRAGSVSSGELSDLQVPGKGCLTQPLKYRQLPRLCRTRPAHGSRLMPQTTAVLIIVPPLRDGGSQ